MRKTIFSFLAMAAGFAAYATIERAPLLAFACLGITCIIILIDRLIDMYEARAARRFHAAVEREVRRRLEADRW